ncbi:MAG: selenocysteine-specific translation elongation factor [Gemmatimonadales bacterium]
MIIGTAGHIDHGKSALVEALTGHRMDRLREERARGITIELNFAPFDLGGGQEAGVVDVPGHEDFVRTMVAGATGIDLILLVIAADEGIMPQSREHRIIAEQLRIPRGIPVITKADLVEAEWLDLVNLEVSEWLQGSAIGFEAPVITSATTGRGVEELRQRILRVAGELPARSEDLFRMPVDRSFSVAGIGTVVTGTVWSGSLDAAEAARIMPGGREVRIRSVESHGKAQARATAGSRAALGLTGVAREDIRRGDMIVSAADPWGATTALDVLLELHPDAPRSLTARTRIRCHLGTAEVMARVHPRSSIEPGRSGVARLALDQPLTARGGDRLVIRSYSPVYTIGGGVVLDPLPPRRGAGWPASLSSPVGKERLLALVERRREGLRVDQLPIVLGPDAPPAIPENTLIAVGEYLVPVTRFRAVEDRLIQGVKEHQRSHPMEAGVPRSRLRHLTGSPASLVEPAVAALAAANRLVVSEGVVRTPDFTPHVRGGEERLDRIVAHLEQAGLAPPSVQELARALDSDDLEGLLRLLAREGRVEAVERDRYYARPALEEFVAALRELGQAGEITPARVRDRLGITRKYLIPLLEWADRAGVTVRVGEGRRLRD